MFRSLAFTAFLLLAISSRAETPAVRMVLQGGATYEGRIVAADQQTCWLAERNGRYQKILLDEVTQFAKTGGSFVPLAPADLRSDLRSEFGEAVEIEFRGQYVVVAPRGRARSVAVMLESTAKAFAGYAGRRKLPAQRMQFPLVVLVLPNWDQFRDQCANDGVAAHPTLRGYYHPHTNRVTLYEGEPTMSAPTQAHLLPSVISPDKVVSLRPDEPMFALNSFHVKPTSPLAWPPELPLGNSPQWSSYGAATGGSLKSTLVHEAIHQLAFNTGLHSRIGDIPRWVPEGLAMLLEGESQLLDAHTNNPGDRVNMERYLTFQQSRSRRTKDQLSQLVTTDDAFKLNPLLAYADTWALTFYLTESRSSRYSDYLKRLARRDPLIPYSAEDRLKDFRELFGSDLRVMDAQLIEFISKLKVRTKK